MRQYLLSGCKNTDNLEFKRQYIYIYVCVCESSHNISFM